MRTKQQEEARYNWLSTVEAGVRMGGVSADHVRAIIQAGDLVALDVRKPGAHRPDYRISPVEVDRWLERRTTTPGQAA